MKLASVRFSLWFHFTRIFFFLEKFLDIRKLRSAPPTYLNTSLKKISNLISVWRQWMMIDIRYVTRIALLSSDDTLLIFIATDYYHWHFQRDNKISSNILLLSAFQFRLWELVDEWSQILFSLGWWLIRSAFKWYYFEQGKRRN